MPAATSLQHCKAALDAYYAGKTIMLALLTGRSVSLSPANNFVSAIEADDDSGVTHEEVDTISTEIDTAADPDRVEIHVTDTTFGSVAADEQAFTGEESDDVITCAGHGYQNGDVVQLSGVTGLTGLSEDTTYFVRDVSTDTFKLAATASGAAIDITLDGSGTVVRGFQRVLYYVALGGASSADPVISHADLSEAIFPNGNNIIIRQGDDGIVHAEFALA